MRLFQPKKSNKERGSATIEAVISFAGFIFVIFTILSVVNFCRAQSLISNAVDTAAKEISQYSYFYKMSGLQKFSGEISANSDQGKTNLNDVLGTVGDLYSSIGTSVDKSQERATDVANAVNEGTINMDSIQNTLAGVKNDADSISNSITSVSNAFGLVQDNPLLYMKSIIAVAGNEALDAIKSHVIAAPLAKSFTAKHFGKNTDEANEMLEGLGVVSGLDGMNFQMSTIFTSDSPEDIHIVVYYKIRILSLFDWATLEVPICKESVARAWLGGDNVQKVAVPMVPAAEPEDEQTSEENANTDENENKDNEEKENESGSTDLWALPAMSEDGYTQIRSKAFMDLTRKEYGFEEMGGATGNLCGVNGSIAYGCTTVKSADSIIRGLDEKTSIIAENAYLDAARAIKSQEDCYDPQGDDPYYSFKPGDVKQYVYVVYVPENISDDEFNKIKASQDLGAEKYKEEAQKVLGREISVDIVFEKAGGNYDYGSEE